MGWEFVGMICRTLLFRGTVTGQSYPRMLKKQFLPELEVFQMGRNVCRLMHDGAPFHFFQDVRERLSDAFASKWMGGGLSTL